MKGLVVVVLAGAISAGVVAGGAGPGGAPPRAEREYATAKETAQRVLAGTKALLESELNEKGPAGALTACSAVALEEAVKHEQPGWRVRRVSLRLRNLADRPTPAEAAVLRRWEAQHRAKRLAADAELAEVGELDGVPVLHYMRPITIGPVCLNCHGGRGQIPADVRRALRETYPKDRATGYRLGDLRGAISVMVPLESAQERAGE